MIEWISTGSKYINTCAALKHALEVWKACETQLFIFIEGADVCEDKVIQSEIQTSV